MTTTTIIIISWFIIIILFGFGSTFMKLFPKKWLFSEVREKIKFSKTMWLNTYATANNWSKTATSRFTWINKLKALWKKKKK